MNGLFICTSELLSQTNKEQILAIRNASNLTLKSYEIEEALSYLTDDVLTIAGSGALLSGKQGLAWEKEIWNGYDPEKGNDLFITIAISMLPQKIRY